MRKTINIIWAVLMLLSCGLKVKAQHTQYAMGIVFRETPFADIRGAKMVAREDVGNKKHFELDYDEKGRLVECRYVLNDQLVSFSDRFVRAPKIKVSYQENKEIRTFYNEFGHRTLVSGDVYEARFVINEKEERTGLTFHNIAGDIIDNDFGIAKYVWETLPNGDVMEWRYNTKDELVRNRPEFQYFVTLFSYNTHGLLAQMTNFGKEGKTPTPDEANVVTTKVGYNAHGQFTEWSNYDGEGRLTRGMTNIAKIAYIPSHFFAEQEAAFIDENNGPQLTNWGVHKVVYRFDEHGNEVGRAFLDTEDRPTNSNSGIGIIRTTFSSDGRFLATRSFFDKDGNPIGLGANKIHEYKTQFDAEGRPIRGFYHNLEGRLVNGSGGYAIEENHYDERGRLAERSYLDADENPVNNTQIGVHRFEYQYKNGTDLEAVNTFSVNGKKAQPNWSPNH